MNSSLRCGRAVAGPRRAGQPALYFRDIRFVTGDEARPLVRRHGREPGARPREFLPRLLETVKCQGMVWCRRCHGLEWGSTEVRRAQVSTGEERTGEYR